jgi:hypothetical protein
MASPTIAWVPEAMILACLSVAVATDLASRIIPNRLVLLTQRRSGKPCPAPGGCPCCSGWQIGNAAE